MDPDFDVFARVTNFCENYTPEIIKPSRAGSGSDSELESLFCSKKTITKKKATASQKPKKSKANSDNAPTNENGSSPPKRRNRRNNKNTCDVNVAEPEPEPEPEQEAVEPITPRRRSRRNNGISTSSIEEYMQQQTAAIIGLEVAPVINNQRGRARRRYMATVASAAPVLCTVDLAGPKTPPLPPRSSEGKNKLSHCSDDECNFSITGPVDAANTSFDLENAEIYVKVKWGDQIDIIPHRKHQKFVDLMRKFAQKEQVDVKDVLLNLDERIIEPDDTPDSINYNIVHVIFGRIIKNTECLVPAKKKDRNTIKVKIQSDSFKKPLQVPMKREQNFKILYIKCSEELKIPCERIKLSFDGDLLNLNETPNDLEFDGGEVIDCRIVQ